MITIVRSHCNGNTVVPQSYINELCSVVEGYKKKLGLYKINDFKNYVIPAIHKLGWSDEYYLDHSSKITITSIKDKTGLCIQTGNMARVYADLLKLQSLYSKGTLAGGIIIVAMASCAKEFGGNIVTFERLGRELEIFKEVITMPLIIIGFENDM